MAMNPRNFFAAVFATLFLAVSLPLSVSAERDASFASVVQPFLKQHCMKCHGEKKQEGRIRYDAISGYRIDDQHLWAKVHEQLIEGEMPPEDETRPAPADKQRVLAWIEQQALAAQQASGTGSVRRLNRRELSAALQDLTGLPIDFAAGLSQDGKVNGFDTGAEGLQDAADSVIQVMDVTRRAVESIRFLEPANDSRLVLDFRDPQFKDWRKALERWKDKGVFTKSKNLFWQEGKGIFLPPQWLGDRANSLVGVPAPSDSRATLLLTLRVSAKKYYPNVPNPQLWVKIGGKFIDDREIAGEKIRTLTYAIRMEDHTVESNAIKVSLRGMVEVPYAVKGFENEDKSKPEDNIPGGTGLFRPVFQGKRLNPEEQPAPFIVVEQMEVDYDHVAAWPPKHWKSDVGDIKDDEQSARRLLELWIERAWRRPASKMEQARFFALYQKLRDQKLSFDEALRAAFQSVLMSGPFRYLASPANPDPVVGQHAIASRLSFMLIGSPPDDELRRLAAAGKLRDPRVLDAQVDRLLSDPRRDAFFRPFVTQWLNMDQPITVAMDYLKKQDFRFGRNLKESMREETIAYVAQLFADNRPAKELVASDWTMMNDMLAVHYGYDGIEGGHLRKVKLQGRRDPRGGGILGHAGIQSMLCWMGDNWVIYRGSWTLNHILDDPPPLPPLEVPELNPSDGANRGKSFKELLRQHQADVRCSVCHKKMDPLGFAFQNFDLSGRWRNVEFDHYSKKELDGKVEWRGSGKSRPVDAVGQLPRGEKFGSYAEFKQLLSKHYQADMVRGVMKNLTLYGTGRKANVIDMGAIRAIMTEQSARGYPLRDLLKALVRSRVFIEQVSTNEGTSK